MNNYSFKNLDMKALDVDSTGRRVKIAIAEMETIDRDGDVFSKSAFNKTIKERGPSGSNEIWHLIDHNATLKSALGKMSELYTDGQYLVGVSSFKDTWLWKELAWPLYESGDITQHSVGFTTIDKESKGTYTEIKEVQLWEGSAVLWGANMNTPTLSLSKSLFQSDDKKGSAVERIDWIMKALKDGKYSADNESLLMIEMKQIQQLISDMGAEVTATPADVPDESSHESEEAKRLLIYTHLINKKIHI